MPIEDPVGRDDFDEPGADALLRRVASPIAHSAAASDSEGASMRGNIFQPPGDLSDLRRRLGEVDRRLGAGARFRKHPTMRRLYSVLAAAAVVGLAAGLYFFVQPDSGARSRITRIALVPVGTTRGQAQGEFRIGDTTRLEVTVSQPCRVYVAVLDSTGLLAAPEADRVYSLEPGDIRQLPIGDHPFVLNGVPGTESFLVLSTEAPLDALELRAIIEKTARDLKPDGKSHEQLLTEALAVLRRDSRIVVEAYTYQLMPASP